MSPTITIRNATDHDQVDLARLAALDETTIPAGEALLALVDGELRAALPLDGGHPVADPFHRTAGLVALLRAAAEHDRNRPQRDGNRPQGLRRRWPLPRMARA
jgi:hypothetical protein